MNAFWIALSMYSRIPTPRVEWDERGLSYALCWFPVVGLAVGLLLWLWLKIAVFLQLSDQLRGIAAALLPLAVCGGIHLDGLCDTCDALGSHQSRERKLEILKDPHIGAFGVIGCAAYLLLLCGSWGQIRLNSAVIGVLALTPVLSRSLSGLFAATLPNARGSGLLATFTDPMNRRRTRTVLVLWIGITAAGMFLLDGQTALAVLTGAAVSCIYYPVMAKRQFGGITGDLEGFFLQLCELAMVLCAALAQAMMEVRL